jgi:hypothetical protein
MADVVNKTTLEYRRSVHTPDYPASEWLINPEIPECEPKYWRILSGKLAKMTTSQREAVDKAILKNKLIMEKFRTIPIEEAIQELKDEGILDAEGEII